MRGLLLIIQIVSLKISIAQDPYFICFQRALLYNNPAFAGSSGQLRVQTAANYLWPGVGGYFNSYAGVDAYLGKGGSAGASCNYQNEYSILTKQEYSVFYSNRIALFRKKLIIQPGIKLSAKMFTVNWDRLKFPQEIDSINGFIYKSYQSQYLAGKGNLGCDLGLLFYSDHFFIGFSISNLLGGDEGVLAGPGPPDHRINLHGMYSLRLNEDITVIPAFQIQHQLDYTFASIGTSAIYKKVAFGLNLNNSRSASINLGYQTKSLAVGLSHTIFFYGLPYRNTLGAFEANLCVMLLRAKSERKFISLEGF